MPANIHAKAKKNLFRRALSSKKIRMIGLPLVLICSKSLRVGRKA